MRTRAVTPVALATMLAMSIQFGCAPSTDCGDLANLTSDADGDGFPEAPAPAGVTAAFDDTSVRVMAVNTLTALDLAPVAGEEGFNPFIAQLLAHTVKFVVRIELSAEYADGSVITLCESAPLGAFERKFEAACPDDVRLKVELVALLPILRIPVAVFPVGLTPDAAPFECGQTVSLRFTTDENGHPV